MILRSFFIKVVFKIGVRHYFTTVWLTNPENVLNLSLYPNPTTGVLNLDSRGINGVRVYNTVGKLVCSINKNVNTVDLSQ